ncbi:MAG: AraC family transcriptional regulator [Verrucomicrobiota bacterium]
MNAIFHLRKNLFAASEELAEGRFWIAFRGDDILDIEQRGDSARSVTDVAFACRFQSSQYFATVFRKQFGLSPRAWRRQKIKL